MQIHVEETIIMSAVPVYRLFLYYCAKRIKLLDGQVHPRGQVGLKCDKNSSELEMVSAHF